MALNDVFNNEQESLFTDRDLVNGLFVVKQGKKVNIPIKLIFGSTFYDKFYGVVYVSNSSIFEELLLSNILVKKIVNLVRK